MDVDQEEKFFNQRGAEIYSFIICTVASG